MGRANAILHIDDKLLDNQQKLYKFKRAKKVLMNAHK